MTKRCWSQSGRQVVVWRKVNRCTENFEKDAVLVIFALEKLRHHFIGGPFIVYMDHKSLRVEFEKVDIYGKLGR